MASEPQDPHAIETFEVLVTAEEAYPAFEREVLRADSEILMSFRIFDLSTGLRSKEAQAIGETWFDLLDDALTRGVDITLVLSDFDPIVGMKYHRMAWKSAEQLAGLEAVSGRGRLSFRIASHPARVGLLPRLAFRPKVREKLGESESDAYTPGLERVRATRLYELQPATHHQKLAVFDRTRLYIGGLDLDERRYDTLEHDQPADGTWADVQALATGPVAEAAARHLETFEATVAGKHPSGPTAPGFLRTLSCRRALTWFHISPRCVCREIEAAHLEAIERATGLIYVETQFFRHQPVADALARAGRANSDLRLMMVLPAAPEDVAFEKNDGKDARMGEALQADAVEKVLSAFGDRALFASPVQPRTAMGSGRDTHEGAPIIYVHSKVSIFGEAEAILSSANLNGRSLCWDTEAGLHLTRPEHVSKLRGRVMEHWFGRNALRGATEGRELFEAAREVVGRSGRLAPRDRAAFLVPYDPEKARSFGEHVPVAPHELV